jgi:hypothetical protein
MLLKKILLLRNEIKKIHEILKESKNAIERIKEIETKLQIISEENKVIKKDFYIIAGYINNIHYFIEENIEHDVLEYDLLKKHKKEEYH